MSVAVSFFRFRFVGAELARSSGCNTRKDRASSAPTSTSVIASQAQIQPPEATL